MSTQTDVCTCSQKQGKGKEKIHDEIKGNFDGSTKTCDYDNFTMTVVKMNMMNNVMDNRRVKIPAQKVTLEYYTLSNSIIDKALNTMECAVKGKKNDMMVCDVIQHEVELLLPLTMISFP